MLKIALAITNNKLDEFRRCKNYFFYTLEKEAKAIPDPKSSKQKGASRSLEKPFS